MLSSTTSNASTTILQTTLPLYDLSTGSAVPNYGIVIPAQTVKAGPTVFNQNLASFDVSLSKPLRNGAEISTDALYTRQNLVADGPVSNVSQLRLTLKVPLLKAFAPSDAAAAESASKIDYAASLLAERHVISEKVYETAAAYWALRAAQERLDLYQQSEATAVSFRNLTAILIDGDERAKAEIHQVDARVAETGAQRVSPQMT